MDDPKHTAKWIEDRIHNIFNMSEPQRTTSITLILLVLDRFENSLGDLYHHDSYAEEKIEGIRQMLLRVVGAEPSGHSPDDLLQFAFGDAGKLASREFYLKN